MKRLIGLTALVMPLLLGAEQARAILIIDDYSTPPGGQIATDTTANGTPVKNSLGGLPVLGGSRELIVNKTGQVGSGAQPVKGSANEVNTSIFNFDQFSSTAKGYAFLYYDGHPDGNLQKKGLADMNGVGVDLTQGGVNTGFVFQNLNVTGSGLKLTVNLYNGLSSLVFTSGPITLTNGMSGNFFLPYSSFSGAGGAGTPANTGSIEILVDGRTAAGSDLTFSLIASAPSAVLPEPSTFIAGLIGGLGLLGFRRLRGARPAA